jgi:hypothetical protein
MIGFYAGAPIGKLLQRGEPLLDTVDSIEAGDVSLKDVARVGSEVLRVHGEKARDALRQRFNREEEMAPTVESPSKPVPALSLVPPKTEDPQELMENFTNPKGGSHGTGGA